MRTRQTLAFSGLALIAALMTGCTKPEATETGTPPKSGTAGSNASGKMTAGKAAIQIKGSDTMVQLAQAWAQDFMKTHPEIAVTVSGGGSNTGIAALMNKGTDIANASRPMKKEEMEAAAKNSVTPKEFIVAQDALSVVVNPSNTITELTLEQLKSVYTGKVTNWKEVGGPDQAIVLNGRESSSGSYVFFQEHVLGKGTAYAKETLLQPATSKIVDNVAADKGGIGYVGLGYVTDKVKSVKIKKDAASTAVEAKAETVLDKTYPLARPLFEYISGEPTGAVKTWLDWVAGTEGQAIVKKLDFVPVK